MNEWEFAKILVGKKRMILCRRSDFASLKERKIRKLIKKAFPEIGAEKGWWEKILQRWEYSVEYCSNAYSPLFDSTVEWFSSKHNWEEEPFIVLQIKINGRGQYCDYRIL